MLSGFVSFRVSRPLPGAHHRRVLLQGQRDHVRLQALPGGMHQEDRHGLPKHHQQVPDQVKSNIFLCILFFSPSLPTFLPGKPASRSAQKTRSSTPWIQKVRSLIKIESKMQRVISSNQPLRRTTRCTSTLMPRWRPGRSPPQSRGRRGRGRAKWEEEEETTRIRGQMNRQGGRKRSVCTLHRFTKISYCKANSSYSIGGGVQ